MDFSGDQLIKDEILNAILHVYIYINVSSNRMRIPLTIFKLTYNLRIPQTSAESATAQFNYTSVFLFVCGFHKHFWIPQLRLRIPQNHLILERF